MNFFQNKSKILWYLCITLQVFTTAALQARHGGGHGHVNFGYSIGGGPRHWGGPRYWDGPYFGPYWRDPYYDPFAIGAGFMVGTATGAALASSSRRPTRVEELEEKISKLEREIERLEKQKERADDRKRRADERKQRRSGKAALNSEKNQKANLGSKNDKEDRKIKEKQNKLDSLKKELKDMSTKNKNDDDDERG